MGLDVYANLVAGAEMKKVYRKSQKTKEVTRYHEETGEPYKKAIAETVHVLGTKEFTQKEWEDFREECYGVNPKLDLFTIAEGPADVIGIRISGTESHRNGDAGPVEVPLADIEDALAKVKKELKVYGIKEKDVKVLLVPRFSY